MIVSLSSNWNAMKKWLMLGLWLAIGVMALRGQSDSLYKVAFYNVENLFHPSDDSLTADEAFTPEGSYHWSYKKYFRKISNVAKVLIAMGRGHPPAVVGLAEIECEQVLKDLCYRSPLRRFGYRYVHHDSPDRRGVDVALLYRDSLVTVVRERALLVVFPFDPQARTRAQQEVGRGVTAAIPRVESRIALARQAHRQHGGFRWMETCAGGQVFQGSIFR